MGEKNDIFCTLYQVWEKNSSIFVENENAYSILSIEPYFAGQGLIIPKRHITQLSDLTQKESFDLLQLGDEFHHNLSFLYSSKNIGELINFYENLKKNPITLKSKHLSSKILELNDLHLKPIGYNLGFNFGEFAGQTINHIHAHYVPRRENDIEELGFGTAMKEFLKK